MSGEIWRDVPSVPGILVSSEGRVMIAPYRKPMPNGAMRPLGGCPSWGTWVKSEGRFVTNVGGKRYYVHRLVAEAFHGAPPDGAVAMHVNENSSDNRASNVAWGSQRENLNAAGFRSYCHGRTGEFSTAAKARRRRDAEWISRLEQGHLWITDTGVGITTGRFP